MCIDEMPLISGCTIGWSNTYLWKNLDLPNPNNQLQSILKPPLMSKSKQTTNQLGFLHWNTIVMFKMMIMMKAIIMSNICNALDSNANKNNIIKTST